jgi:single-stranded-DNA-specific exonuclease
MQPSARMQIDTDYGKSNITPLRGQSKIESFCKKQWSIHPPDERAAEFAKSLKISPVLAQVLINRGITDSQNAAAFLRPKLTQLIEPERMPGIEPAVKRIKHAIKNKEKITVYGDYDVDGITGVSILWQALTLIGADVDYYIPHRIDEG